MSIAALTSSISMLEVPVAFLVERFNWGRTCSSGRHVNHHGYERHHRPQLRHVVRAGDYGQHALLSTIARICALYLCGLGVAQRQLTQRTRTE